MPLRSTRREALTEPHQRQQHRRCDAHLLVGRQQSDGESGDPHGQQRADERGLSPCAIAEMPEQHRPQRARHERQTERGQQRGGAIAFREEQVREDGNRGRGIAVA